MLLLLCQTQSAAAHWGLAGSVLQGRLPHSMVLQMSHSGAALRAGRWKGVPIAIKVVDHTAYVGTRVDALRESVLSTSVQHPNVVRCR